MINELFSLRTPLVNKNNNVNLADPRIESLYLKIENYVFSKIKTDLQLKEIFNLFSRKEIQSDLRIFVYYQLIYRCDIDSDDQILYQQIVARMAFSFCELRDKYKKDLLFITDIVKDKQLELGNKIYPCDLMG